MRYRLNNHEIQTDNDQKAMYLRQNGYRMVDKPMEFTKQEMDLYKEWVMTVEYTQIGRKTTVALLTTEEGFEIVGTSACVDVASFNREIGEHYALKDALRQLDTYVGFYRHLEQL